MSSISRTRREEKRYIVNRESGRTFDFTAGCFLPGRSETAWNRRGEGRVLIAYELLPVFVETTA